MAQGNDAAAALSELHGQYGVHPNAEALVQAHRAAQDPALERAARQAINGEATAELDLEKIKPERGGTVLAASVRGNAIVYVAEDESGRTYKGITPWKGKKAVLHAESPQDAAARASLGVHTMVNDEAARINAEIEQEVAEFRAKLQQKKGAELAEAIEDAQKESQKLAERAEKEAAKSDKGDDETAKKSQSAPPNDPAEAGGPKQASSEQTEKSSEQTEKKSSGRGKRGGRSSGKKS